MDEKSLVYNKSHYAVMANDVIKGKQEMTLQEARIIRLLITQIAMEDKDLKTYTCRIQDLADFLDIPSDNLYRDVKNICINLLKRVVEVSTGDSKQPWRAFQWVSRAEYDGKGNLTLKLSEEISKHVLELNEWFTKYTLNNILYLNSFFSIRLYELIKCQDGVHKGEEYCHEFTIEYLRTFFGCENKYKLNADFIKNTILLPIKEISEKTDMILTCENIKTGREITAVRIYIVEEVFKNAKK